MSTIQFPGLSTGIDTKTIISQLMAVEQRTLNTYQARQDTWNEKKDALSTLETKLSTLRTSVNALSNSDELRAFSVASSNSDILTAEASYNAFEGNHSVVISQLATAERSVSIGGIEYPEDYIGAGTFIYSYNNKETTITTTGETTLEEFVGLINNDANNPGVTASLLYYNNAYHLVLNANDAGTDYKISINPSSTEVWKAGSEFTVNGDNATLSTKITDLDQFGKNHTLEGGEVIEITGTDHNGSPIAQVNLAVTSHTTLAHLISEINNAFDGIAKATLVNGQIVLTDSTSGTSGLSIHLNYNPGTSQATLTLPEMAFSTEGGIPIVPITGFTPTDFTETQSAQDAKIKVDGYPPGESDWIQRSSNTIDDVIYGVTLHLHDTTTDANGEQITLTRDIQSIKDKLTAMVNAYNDAVTYIQKNTGYDNVSKTAGILMGDYVVSTTKSLLRTPVYAKTAGFIEDIDTFLMPGQLGLNLDKNGLLNLDTNAFDKAVTEDYMSVLALIGADKTGSSSSNAVEFYSANSNYTTAGEYNIEVVVSSGPGGNKIDSAKIKLATESTYRNATFSGNIVTGNSSFDDKGNPLCPENGLQLSVDLTKTGKSTVTVNVKQGFAGAIGDVLDKMLKTNSGSMDIDQKYAGDQVKLLQDKIDNEQVRLTKKQDELTARFARLEKTLTLIQQQMSALQK